MAESVLRALWASWKELSPPPRTFSVHQIQLASYKRGISRRFGSSIPLSYPMPTLLQSPLLGQ